MKCMKGLKKQPAILEFESKDNIKASEYLIFKND